MFPQTVHPKTASVLKKISPIIAGGDFYLAGGTALALHLGHRISVDLDFFIQKNFIEATILASLPQAKVQFQSEQSLDLIVEGVKVSFMQYDYSILEKFVQYEKIDLASILDIACMKLTAISSRGSKKDFIDLAFILEKYSLPTLFEATARKYRGIEYSTAHLLKSLTYFADAENDPDPIMLIDKSWEQTQQEIKRKVAKEGSIILI